MIHVLREGEERGKTFLRSVGVGVFFNNGFWKLFFGLLELNFYYNSN